MRTDSLADGAAPRKPASRATHTPGEPGVWVFIVGDMCVFAVLFGTFIYARGQHPVGFEHARADLHRVFGVLNTLLLLTSSLAVNMAVRAMRAAHRRLAGRLLAAAMLCGAAFLINKGLEWSSLLSAHHTPAANDFFMYFFILTGIHAMHLVLGMAVLAVLLALSRRSRLTQRQRMFVEGGACFWHLVDLLWVVLFALLYLVR